ncbi:MAG: hypothetical protein HYX79_00235 [Chloroflexi bacterium]|nr:hypothetical protein [Chloroflexota bacterium]
MVKNKISACVTRLIQDADVGLAILAAISAGALFFKLTGTRFGPVALTLLVACLVYLLVRKRTLSVAAGSQTSAGPLGYLAFNAVFFALFAASLMVIKFRPELYVRPTAYFFITVALTSVLATEIMSLPQRGRYAIHTLMRIVLITVSLQVLPQIIFYDSLSGSDVWDHRYYTQWTLATGHTPEWAYGKIPVFHMIVGGTSLVTGLDYKFASLLSVGTFYIAVLPLVFLMVKRLFNTRLGLLACLALATANWYVYRGVLDQVPHTLGVVFLVIIIYCVLFMEPAVKTVFICISFIALATLSNTLSAFQSTFILFIIWVTIQLYRWLYREGSTWASANLWVLSFVGMFSHWMYVTGAITSIALRIEWAFGLQEMYIKPFAQTAGVPQGEVLLNDMGLLIFYGISILGVLVCLSKRYRNSHVFYLLVTGFAFAVLGLYAYSGSKWLLSDRWLGPSVILLAPAMGAGLDLISKVFKARLWQRIMPGMLVAILTFFMITNATGNYDNPIYSEKTTLRYSNTSSEMAAASTLTEIIHSRMIVSSYYLGLLRPPYQPPELQQPLQYEEIQERLVKGDFDTDVPIVVQEYNTSRNLWYGSLGFVRIDYDLKENLSKQGLSRIYDSGSVFVYLKTRIS